MIVYLKQLEIIPATEIVRNGTYHLVTWVDTDMEQPNSLPSMGVIKVLTSACDMGMLKIEIVESKHIKKKEMHLSLGTYGVSWGLRYYG